MFECLLWLRETDSTQLRLKEWSLPWGTVVVADRQKRGKGRKGRRWESQEGGLYFSFVLNAEDFREVLQLPLVVGFSISNFLDSVGIETAIKWPNDVYAQGRKIAGVLAERSGNKVVVGIGLNVNQEAFPEHIRNRATSMKLVRGNPFDRRDVLSGLLFFLKRDILLYQREGFYPFLKPIRKKLLFVGSEVVVLSEEQVTGTLEGIDDKGFLLLRTPEGYKRITAGDVSLRPSL